MTGSKPLIVGIGELILDEYLSAGEYPGGVPTNYVRHVNRLGCEGVLVSRIGKDAAGTKLLQMLHHDGLDTSFIQQDEMHPTARITIEIGPDGQPIYRNAMPVAAYDYLAADSVRDELALSADAIVFTALGQLNTVARQSIQEFIHKSNHSFVMLDCNWRHAYPDATEILDASFRLADAVKLNLKEISLVQNKFGFAGYEDLVSFLFNEFNLKFILLTTGPDGAVYFGPDQTIQAPAIPTDIVDLTGCGDAFGAAALVEYLKGSPPEKILDAGLKSAAAVAKGPGAFPGSLFYL